MVSPILEVAIGVILVFMVVAVIVSTITEAISGILKVRARTLERGLEVMLGQGTNDWLYKLPLIATSTPPGKQGRPAYIDAVTFSTSLLGAMDAPTNATLLAAILPAAASTRRTNIQTALVGLNAVIDEAIKHNYSPDSLSGYLLDQLQSGPRLVTVHSVALIAGSLDDAKTAIGGLGADNPAKAPLQEMLAGSPSPQSTDDLVTTIVAYNSPGNLPSLAHLVGTLRGVGLSSKSMSALNVLAQRADNDVTAFRESIEDWFDREMDRVSGTYNRWSQVVMFAIALALAIGANISAYTVGRSLWLDPSLRAQAVATAQQTVSTTTTTTSSSGTTATPPPAPTYQTLRSLGMPIGWSKSNWPKASDVGDIILVALGWLIIAVAASMGAPFWFDTLNKFVNLRTSGPPPDTAAVQRAKVQSSSGSS